MATRRYRSTRRYLSQVLSRWKRRTRKGRWSGFHASVRMNKSRTKIRYGKRRHRRGFSWTGRRGSVALSRRGRIWATNPGRILAMGKNMILSPITGLPKNLPALLRGKPVKNLAYAGGGAMVGLIGGNTLQGFVMPLASKIPGVSNAMSGGILQRVVGAAFALIAGGVVGKVAIKDPSARNSFVTGTAAAVLVEAIFPGRIAALLTNVPVVGNFFAAHASPVAGLAGLFGTNDLAGIGEYVIARNNQSSLGAYVQMPGAAGSMNGLGTYVQSPADQNLQGLGYRGERLAGLGNLDGMGSNMPSHLDS